MPQTYDVVLSTPSPNYEYFSRRLMELCGQMGPTFFRVNDVWVKDFWRKLESEEISVRVLMDLTADQMNPDNLYTQLARAVKRQKGYVLDDPDLSAIAADKAHLHESLLENLIPVPETVVVQRDEIKDFKITDDLVAQVGSPFVVKPARGGVGIVVGATSKDDLLKSAAEAPKSDSFLIQQLVSPRELGDHFGWFRVYYICGQVIPCWWDQSAHEYHLVSPGQMRHYKLNPLKRIVRGIARVSRMKKFSSSVVLHQDGHFYAVDYVNADPDCTPRSFFDNGVPDEVVRHIVWLLFTEAIRVIKRGQGFLDEDLAEAEMGWIDQRRLEQMA
jgi:hypothetical protein